MSDKKSWFATYWKDLLKVVTAIFIVFYVAVFAGVWEDRNYSSNFWPNFFMITRIILAGVIVVGWVIAWTSQNKKQ